MAPRFAFILVSAVALLSTGAAARPLPGRTLLGPDPTSRVQGHAAYRPVTGAVDNTPAMLSTLHDMEFDKAGDASGDNARRRSLLSASNPTKGSLDGASAMLATLDKIDFDKAGAVATAAVTATDGARRLLGADPTKGSLDSAASMLATLNKIDFDKTAAGTSVPDNVMPELARQASAGF